MTIASESGDRDGDRDGGGYGEGSKKSGRM